MNHKGLTLVELLISIVVIGIIGGFSAVQVSKIIENTQLNADKSQVFTLNTATNYYAMAEDIDDFNDIDLTDQGRIELLYNLGFTDKLVEAKTDDALYSYNFDTREWSLVVDDEVVQLTPYGNDSVTIVSSFITTINTHYNETGSYGRSWGDYRYTDYGLDPDDWDEPVDHMYYRPSGNKFYITPEDNYSFTVYNDAGDRFYLDDSYNWSIIYDFTSDAWYFHTTSDPDNIVNIDTLVVEPTN